MKKLGLFLTAIAMVSFGPQAHAQVGDGAAAGASASSGWAWTIGIAGTLAILATGGVIGAVSSSTQNTFNH